MEKFWTDSERYRIKGGNQQIAYKLAEKIDLNLNCPIAKITSDGITDIHGNEYLADYIVLAIPPSVWHTINLKLPVLQMGLNIKHISSVKGCSFNMVGNKKINQIWDGTEGQLSDYSAAVVFNGADSVNEEINLEEFYPNIKIIHSELVDWVNEKWTYGGYSCPAPGEITTIGPILQQGLGKLLFAGEHTCYKFFGFMEGAIRSGIETANKISSFQKKQ